MLHFDVNETLIEDKAGGDTLEQCLNKSSRESSQGAPADGQTREDGVPELWHDGSPIAGGVVGATSALRLGVASEPVSAYEYKISEL